MRNKGKNKLRESKRDRKKIRELSESEKAEKRKIWRDQKKKQREAKKQAGHAELAAATSTACRSSRSVDYKKKYKNLVKKYNTVLKQLKKVRNSNQRLRKTMSQTNIRHQRESEEKTEEIDKLKARHEVLEIALSQTYKECKTHDQKRVLRSIGKVNFALPKKGVQKIIAESLGLKSTLKFKQRNKCLNKNIKEDLEVFYNRDEISRSTSGKRECRTKNKKKMQIRYLTDTLNNLYQIYKEEGGKN